MMMGQPIFRIEDVLNCVTDEPKTAAQICEELGGDPDEGLSKISNKLCKLVKQGFVTRGEPVEVEIWHRKAGNPRGYYTRYKMVTWVRQHWEVLE